MEPDDHPLLNCPECCQDMNREIATQWVMYGAVEALHYVCPNCGLSSSADVTLEGAQSNWNALVITLKGD